MSGLDAFFERLKGTGPWVIESGPPSLAMIRCEGRCPLEVAAGRPAGGVFGLDLADLGLTRDEFESIMGAADAEYPDWSPKHAIRERLLDLVNMPEAA